MGFWLGFDPQMRTKVKRVGEEEVRQMWASLDMEQRQRVLRFDDVVLVDRVGVALQTLFQKQAMMNHMGIKLCGTSENPFGNDKLLMNAFEFTWQFCEPKNNPELVVV